MWGKVRLGILTLIRSQDKNVGMSFLRCRSVSGYAATCRICIGAEDIRNGFLHLVTAIRQPGNAAGDIYVYDTSTGARAAHYSTQKMRGPARAATLSEDGRHLLTVHGNGYILRYNYTRFTLVLHRAGGHCCALK